MKRSVYVETTIPSCYYEARTEPIMIARWESTRKWWAEERPGYELFTSPFVIGELQGGEYPGKEEAIRLHEDVSILEIVSEIEGIAKV